MKKLLVYICTLMMAFTFASCQTSTIPKTPTGMYKNLDAKWSGTVNWKSEGDSGSYYATLIAQKGVIDMEISVGRVRGIIEGNTIHMESIDFVTSKGVRVHYPDRDFIISEDGKTVPIDFEGTWSQKSFGDDRPNSGVTKYDGILTRE